MMESLEMESGIIRGSELSFDSSHLEEVKIIGGNIARACNPSFFFHTPRKVQILHNSGISDSSLAEISDGISCPVEELCLSGCTKLRDIPALRMPNLKVLNLSATNISSESLKKMLTINPQITTVDITGCPELSKRFKSQLSKSFPTMKITDNVWSDRLK